MELDIWASVKSIFVRTSWGKVCARARNSFTVEFRDKKTFAERILDVLRHHSLSCATATSLRQISVFSYTFESMKETTRALIFWRTRPLTSLRTALGLRGLMSVSQAKEQSGFVRQSIACVTSCYQWHPWARQLQGGGRLCVQRCVCVCVCESNMFIKKITCKLKLFKCDWQALLQVRLTGVHPSWGSDMEGFHRQGVWSFKDSRNPIFTRQPYNLKTSLRK